MFSNIETTSWQHAPDGLMQPLDLVHRKKRLQYRHTSQLPGPRPSPSSVPYQLERGRSNSSVWPQNGHRNTTITTNALSKPPGPMLDRLQVALAHGLQKLPATGLSNCFIVLILIWFFNYHFHHHNNQSARYVTYKGGRNCFFGMRLHQSSISQLGCC